MKCSKSDIPWCDYGASPVTGCRHKCEWCYARSMVRRYGSPDGNGLYVLDAPAHRCHTEEVDGNDAYRAVVDVVDRADPYPFGFAPTFHRYRLDAKAPRKPGRVFVCPMADLWGEWVPPAWQDEVLAACAADTRHQYLFLTKNPARYFERDWPEWAWLGATATNLDEANDRSWYCSEANGDAIPWLSCEPWLGGDDLRWLMFQKAECAWLVVGPLTGTQASKAPPVSRDAVFALRDNCAHRGVALFVKPSATAWGLTPEEISGMQAWSRQHPSQR